MSPTTLNAQIISTEDTDNVTFVDAGIVTGADEDELFYDNVEDGVLSSRLSLLDATEIPNKRGQIMSRTFAFLAIAFVGTLAVTGHHRNSTDNSPMASTTTVTRHLNLDESCPAVDINVSCNGCKLEFEPVEIPSDCTSAPTLLEMLFRGGSCEENAFPQNIQPVSCVDQNQGPPKLGTHEPAYIRALDMTTQKVLFAGTVLEGDVYDIASSNGDELVNNIAIDMFSDDTMQTPLQSVIFDASCSDTESDNSPLINVFGASQVVKYVNNAQGTVSAFVANEYPDMTFNVELSIAGTGDVGTITMQELQIRSNVLYPTPLVSFPVDGSEITSASPLELSFQSPFNPSLSEAEVIVYAKGISKEGTSCEFADYAAFPIIME